MRRFLPFLFTGLIAVVLLTAASLAGSAPTSAATNIAPTTTCSDGVDNAGGQGLICQVKITNTFTASGSSATVTVRECHGGAGAPTAACFVHNRDLGSAVTKVNQCNDSANGGGATLRCSVTVKNRFVGITPAKADVTVNQCVGSGNPGALTSGCDPFPANTTSATITQCNGSANGGTLVGLTCTANGTQTSGHNLQINQCNGSGNGGGALVICSANVTTVIVAAVTPPPTARPTAPGATPTAPGATPTAPGATPTAPGATPTAPGSTPAPTLIPGAEATPTAAATRGPKLPNTSTGIDTGASNGPGPLLPAALLVLLGLPMVAWFKRQNSSATDRSAR